MKIAIIGATGLVGRTILKVIEERKLPFSEIYFSASANSIGDKIIFQNKEYNILPIKKVIEQKPNIAIFAAGSGVAEQYAPILAQNGTFVIDNSSAFRTDKDKKLIIPEINAQILQKTDKIIANPNCSTIQMLIALYPLHKEYKISRIVVSTYQAVTGTGQKAVNQLISERNSQEHTKVYPYQIDMNCIPQCDVFLENGYTKEEMKLVNETHKIFNDNNIKIASTAVRVPVLGGHSESINVQFEKNFEIEEIFEIYKKTNGITLLDDIARSIYPMPILAQNTDNVLVGRIRKDLFQENTLNMWVVADNLRKGAATNAVQIAEYIINSNF